MTLEQQMLKAIEKARYEYGGAVGGSEDSFIAHETAKIALELAREAYDQGGRDAADYYHGCHGGNFKKFIQDYD